MKTKKGFTLVELIAVITILALLLGLVTMNVIEFYNKQKQKDYENTKSIIEDSAKVYINTDSDIYNEVDDTLQGEGSCRLSYDRLVDNGFLDENLTNPVDRTAFYGNNKYIQITLDDGEYAYEFMEENDDTVAYCSSTDGNNDNSKLCRRATHGQIHAGLGQVGTIGQLHSGDAFICDVDGDGYYADNELFYYVSDYFDTETKTFDSSYAALIYYDNLPKFSTTKYHEYVPMAGPGAAKTLLPTNEQWSNITLYKEKRAILGEYKAVHNATSHQTSTNGTPTSGNQQFPTNFSYAGYAARLLTAQELMSACGLTQIGWYETVTSELGNCNYLQTLSDNGYWLETNATLPSAFKDWIVEGFGTSACVKDVGYNSTHGVRPVIDVPKSRMQIN